MSRIVPIILLLAAVPAYAQTVPTTAPAASEPAATAPDDTSSEARAILDLLEKRGDTLKDFHGTLAYSVYHAKTDEAEANDGYIDYIKAPTGGTRFSVRRSNIKLDGKIMKQNLELDMVFDGQWLTLIDPLKKIFRRIQVAPPVAPGQPAPNVMKIDGPIPMPIGQKTADVIKEFQVQLLPTKDENLLQLKLTPRIKGKYDFSELDLTIDRRMQIPVKMVSTAPRGDVTTVEFHDLQINQDHAKIIDVKTPDQKDGWTVEITPLKP